MSKIVIDPDELTLDEVEEMERLLGGDFEDAFSNGKPKAGALRIMVYLVKRRTDPNVTLESVGSTKLRELDLEDDDEGNDESATPSD